MALKKNERILNLLFALMSTKQFLTKEQLRQIIEVYRPLSDEAFERQFERDKEQLRALGVPIETGSHDPWGPADGYRVSRTEIELPDIDLSGPEAAIVALAGQVWQDSSMGDAVTTSLTKLKTIGIDVEAEPLRVLTPLVKVADDSFEDILNAIQSCRAISFSYSDARGGTSVRKLQAWQLFNWQDRWYVGGLDLDRDEPRVFRLSRFASKPKEFGPPNAYEPPSDVEWKNIATQMFKTGGTHKATLAVSKGRGQLLRQRADAVELGSDADQITIRFANLDDFAAEVCSFGPDIVALEPIELRDRMIEKLTEIAGAS